MVDEFSAFARMPQPVMEAGSLYDLVAGQIKLFESKKLKISLEVDHGKTDYVIICDSGLLRQAVTNLLQNAQESLLEHHVKLPHIKLFLQETEEETILTVSDNGPGFPDMDIAQLLEPYITTRQKAPGLGLPLSVKSWMTILGVCNLARQMVVVLVSNCRSNAHSRARHRHGDGYFNCR